jgi:hypothetical protein
LFVSGGNTDLRYDPVIMNTDALSQGYRILSGGNLTTEVSERDPEAL